MRFLFRWAFRLVLLMVVLVVAVVLLKDTLLKSFAEYKIRSETGLDARIGRIASGLFSPTFTIENLKLYNAAEYGGSPLLDIPELHLECRRGPLALQKLQFKLVRLDLQEVNVVENKNGNTNIVGMLGALEKLTSSNTPEPSWMGLKFQGIEILNLTLGKIRYSSLKKPGKTTEVELGLKNEIITDIKTLPQLTDLLLNAMLKKGITISSASSQRPQRTTTAETPQSQQHRGVTVKPRASGKSP